MAIGGWGLQITARDMAKLGFLYLHEGAWEGKQVVSRAWVAEATRTHVATDSSLGYGYQWWTYPSLQAYTALGLYGQTIFVIPRLDLIVVTTAQLGSHEPVYKLIEDYVVPAAGGKRLFPLPFKAGVGRVSSLQNLCAMNLAAHLCRSVECRKIACLSSMMSHMSQARCKSTWSARAFECAGDGWPERHRIT